MLISIQIRILYNINILWDILKYFAKITDFVNPVRITKCKTYLLIVELLKLSIICKISRVTTFIKFKK